VSLNRLWFIKIKKKYFYSRSPLWSTSFLLFLLRRLKFFTLQFLKLVIILTQPSDKILPLKLSTFFTNLTKRNVRPDTTFFVVTKILITARKIFIFRLQLPLRSLPISHSFLVQTGLFSLFISDSKSFLKSVYSTFLSNSS